MPPCEKLLDGKPCGELAIACIASNSIDAIQLDVCADCYRDKVLDDKTHSIIHAYDLDAVSRVKR